MSGNLAGTAGKLGGRRGRPEVSEQFPGAVMKGGSNERMARLAALQSEVSLTRSGMGETDGGEEAGVVGTHLSASGLGSMTGFPALTHGQDSNQ